jgi:hypothetical protein
MSEDIFYRMHSSITMNDDTYYSEEDGEDDHLVNRTFVKRPVLIAFGTGVYFLNRYLKRRLASKIMDFFIKTYNNKSFDLDDAIDKTYIKFRKKRIKIMKSIDFLKSVGMIRRVSGNSYKIVSMDDHVRKITTALKNQGMLKKRKIIKTMKKLGMDIIFSKALLAFMIEKGIFEEIGKNTYNINASIDPITYFILTIIKITKNMIFVAYKEKFYI